MITIEQIKKRAAKAWDEMALNRPLWEDAYEFFNPYRNSFHGDGAHHRPTRVYDSTAAISAQNFVNTMTGKFTPVFSRWLEIESGPLVPNDKKRDNDAALEYITNVLTYRRNSSNFYTAIDQVWYETGIGTGPMLILEGDEEKPINYVPIPLSKCAIEDGKFGEVAGLYRKHTVKLMAINATWTKAQPTSGMLKRQRDTPDREEEFQEAIYWDYEDLIWRHCVWNGLDEEFVMEDTSIECPFTCHRWSKIPGFATGIGPFVMALADVKAINKMKELQLQMAAMNAFGMYTIRNTQSINPNMIRIAPGQFIPVDDNGANPSIRRFPDAGNFQVQEYMLNDIKTQIRQLMLDNRLPQEKYGQSTVFEIAQRLKEGQVDIGAAFGRLIYEFVHPLARREISILARRGDIELPEGFELDNLFTSVKVVSPIAAEQKFEDVQKFVNAYQISSGLSPEIAMASFKVEDVPEWVADQLGVPSSLLRSKAERQQLQQLAAQAQQQGMAQQQQGMAQQQQGMA